MKILTWMWKQHPNRAGYDAEKVNHWAASVRRHLTLPHTLACVTDDPDGIDPDVEIIPLPRDFDGLHVSNWSEAAGLPQCYRRLKLWAPDAAEYFGDDDLVSMDLDVLIMGSMDSLFAEPADFRMFAGTARTRPYNGSMVRIRAGARRKVWDVFCEDPLGVAKAARAQYIGSDQAVVSMILGRGEATWGPADGVYHYSAGFSASHGARYRHPPPNMSVLFFPGSLKPWDPKAHQVPWVAAAWGGGASTSKPPARPRLRAYRDPTGWGQAFAKAAAARGHFCSQFTRARMVPTGVAFVRLDQRGPQRDISRRMVAELNRQGIPTLPTAREALWYDDKGAQIEALQQWMPRTRYFRDPAHAEEWARTEAVYPLVSKSIDGSGSKGVRLIGSQREAMFEVQRAFRAPGIQSVYDRWQLGYVYWQDLVPDNPCDYRVCVVGEYLYGLIRNVRPGDFRASGSGSFKALTMETERERAAAELAVEIADTLGTDWMAFDIVFDGDRPMVLEMSSAWTMKAYQTAPCFSRKSLLETGRTGADSFTIAVDIMERMACEKGR